MPISEARRFLKQAMQDSVLRNELDTAPDAAARTAILEERGYGFTPDELESAFHGLHADCQHELQAEALQQVRLWWDFLSRT